MDETNSTLRRERRMIKHSIWFFVLGNVFFLTICAAIAWYGCICVRKFFTQWHLQSWEKWSILIGLGGIVLFFQIIISLFQKGNIPKGYREINSTSHPLLFGMIDGIRNQLKISNPIRVFLTDKVSASIFVLPDIQNMIRKPERFLSIGTSLVSSLSEEELKAVLLHEFAHVTQDEINDTGRASSIGLFAKSFLSERIEYKASNGPGNLTLFLLVIYYQFIESLCRYAKRHYERLADELEFEADEIALQHTEPQTLAKALLHIINLSGETEIPASIKKRIERMGVDSSMGRETHTAETNTAKLFIHLAHRKHFIPWVDYTYSLLLNGKDIGEGNFIKGFTIEKDVLPNVYTIEVSSYITTFESRPYSFEVDAGFVYHIELDYKYSFKKTKYIIFCQEMNVYNLK